MKHVFVETNFLVDLLRPLSRSDATDLFARNSGGIRLYLPWVSVNEAKRTITSKIVYEDLGFADRLKQFGVKLLNSRKITHTDMGPIQTLEQLVKQERTSALASVISDVDDAVSKMTVIQPSLGVVAKTVSLFPVKSLPPFDEMVLGAVLFEAAALHARGESALYFCNKNSKDFAPKPGNLLGKEYAACGLTYKDDFVVP